MTKVSKVDVPSEHWDRLYSPVACAVMITTVDKQGARQCRFVCNLCQTKS